MDAEKKSVWSSTFGRIKKGFLGIIPIALFFFLLWELVSHLSDLGANITHNPYTGFLASAIALLFILYSTGLFLEKFHVDSMKEKIFSIVSPKLFAALKQGRAEKFPEVEFPTYGEGQMKLGIVTKTWISKRDGKEYCLVIEPRPLSLSPPVHKVQKSKLTPTGRSGLDLLTDVNTLGMNHTE